MAGLRVPAWTSYGDVVVVEGGRINLAATNAIGDSDCLVGRGGSVDCGTRGLRVGDCRVTLDGADVGRRSLRASKTEPALVIEQASRVAAGIDERAAGQRLVRLGRAAVVLKRAEHRVGANG